jgi:hypothetical protein
MGVFGAKPRGMNFNSDAPGTFNDYRNQRAWRRQQRGTVERTLFNQIQKLIAVRKEPPALSDFNRRASGCRQSALSRPPAPQGAAQFSQWARDCWFLRTIRTGSISRCSRAMA